jgi:hypothetical protein
VGSGSLFSFVFTAFVKGIHTPRFECRFTLEAEDHVGANFSGARVDFLSLVYRD